MTSFFWPLFFLGAIVSLEQKQSFRSILIERACEKRPDLQFCGSLPESSSSVVPLVLPPLTTLAPSTTTAATTTTTTSSSPVKPTGTTDSVDFEELETAGNETSAEHEKLGSLVKLPKPEKTNAEKVVDHVIEQSGVQSGESKNSTTPAIQIEDEKGVLVFVSEYCVVERERFVRSCHGDVDKKEETFCKTYVSACASTTGVLPVMTYCARYYTYYPTYCKSQLVDPKALQFCFAFEQFCLPQKTAAQPSQKPKSSLRKCEDVLPEARKVCNPFPNPKDTFNLLRCTHFLTNCKKFVDWL
ncbi:unnamed protein product [Caenorhabditis sp. 36 PRJEB53466]|nr:unnamed protein product [Caenorhabditis sp. 36 PRJEB53466]